MPSPLGSNRALQGLASKRPSTRNLIALVLHAILPDMTLVTTETIPGQEILAVHGIVEGNSVRMRHVGKDVAQSFKNLLGGDLAAHAEMLAAARKEAVERLTQQATALGGNAVVNVRFATTAITASVAEVFVYGTAVTVRPFGTPGVG